MTTVKLDKKVDYETLEKVLIKSAKEVGLDYTIEDTFNEEFTLGPGLDINEKKEYSYTSLDLKEKDYYFYITPLKKGESIDRFVIGGSNLEGPKESKEKIRDYLLAVSKELYK